MSVLETETLPLPVELVGDCHTGDCLEFAVTLHKAVEDRKYQVGASIMDMPNTLLDWRAMHRTARKRADRAQRLGYRFNLVDYSQYAQDIHDINTSKETRQGRPMSDGYRHYVERSRLPDYPCRHHRTITYGVLQADTLRAYLTLHRSGELALVSMILGHGDHLKDDIMYLLVSGVIGDQAGSNGLLYYNRHDSGAPGGLVYFKERLGFHEGNVEWVL